MAVSSRFLNGLAHDFHEARPGSGDSGSAFAVWMHMVTITANHLSRHNARFSYPRFYEACGMPEQAIHRLLGTDAGR